MSYLPVSVYSSEHDCSNNGISKTHVKKLVIEHPHGHITADEVEEYGYVVLELITRNIGGEDYKHLKQKGQKRWTMFGGNYASTSDSRFSDLNRYPLAIHDRIED